MTGASELSALGTATLLEAWPAALLIDRPLRPLAAGMVLAGPALTVACAPGDNLALHLAIAAARPGDVLVVDYGGRLDSGPFGEIMALACRMHGVVGLLIDGAVRDSAQIAASGFPVFCLGLNIRGTTKLDAGTIGGPLRMGSANINPGDMVVADADGIICIPAQDMDAAFSAASARAAREALMMDRLRAGETTLQILGLQEASP